jgi:hypothetical protein
MVSPPVGPVLFRSRYAVSQPYAPEALSFLGGDAWVP